MMRFLNIVLFSLLLMASHLAEASSCCSEEIHESKSTSVSIEHSHTTSHHDSDSKNQSCDTTDCHHCHHGFISFFIPHSFVALNPIGDISFSTSLLVLSDFNFSQLRPPNSLI